MTDVVGSREDRADSITLANQAYEWSKFYDSHTGIHLITWVVLNIVMTG
jgi:hypothetical protein